jgi:hypothetical protein
VREVGVPTLLLFIDGIGIGRDDPGTNPFAAIDASALAPLRGREPIEDGACRPLDATLGVPGLPQSATGQTTLFTGVNASRLLGRHQVGIPGPTLWPVLERESLFRKIEAAGGHPTFANGYTTKHLSAERPRWSATTRMVLGSSATLRRIDDPSGDGIALIHDYTGDWAASRGIDVPRRTADEAAEVLVGLLADHDLVLYEYFLTDLAGHRGSTADRLEQARRAEALVAAALARLDRECDRLVVVSDHGNLEEADHDRHTRNPVPLLAWGARAGRLIDRVSAMTELTPALVEEIGRSP